LIHLDRDGDGGLEVATLQEGVGWQCSIESGKKKDVWNGVGVGKKITRKSLYSRSTLRIPEMGREGPP
jgi:hypothetical protein